MKLHAVAADRCRRRLPPAPRGDGRLAITCQPGAILIEVSDASQHVPYALASDPRRIGGRGLHLVKALSLTWGVRRITGGKVVWAEVALTGPPATAATAI